MVAEPSHAPAPVAAASPVAPVEEPKEEAPPAPVGEADFWAQLVATVQERRPLAVSWLQVGSLLGIIGKTVRVGFPTSESFARDSLVRPAQLSFLESLAQELMGQPMKFELVLDASLKPPAFTEMGLGLLDEPTPAPAPAPAVEVKPEPLAAPEAAAAPAAEEAAAPDPSAEFYNDPLIQQAIVKFKAKLVPSV